MPLTRCQRETSSTQFLEWMEYLEQDLNAFHREDYFLAQIAQEIRRTVVKEPEEVKIETFLRKFEKKVVEVKRKLTREEAAEKSKRRWLPWAGLSFKKEK